VAVGTVHGLYRSKPNLDFERLRKISGCVDIPLVMHGGTGVGEDGFRAAIANGISKVNIATDLSLTGVHAVEKLFEERKGNLHFYQIQEAARSSIARYLTPKTLAGVNGDRAQYHQQDYTTSKNC